MADHSYLLYKVLGWKSNSLDSWASVSHAQEVLNIDVSWKKPSLQIEPIWAPHDCVGCERIFPWRAFPCRLLLWAMGDEGSANARSCQVLPGVGDRSGWPVPVPQHRQEQPWALGSSLGTIWGQGHQPTAGQGCGELEPGPAMGMRLERAAKHLCKLWKGSSRVSWFVWATVLVEVKFSKA